MAIVEKIGFQVDVSHLEQAIVTLNEFSSAVERASAAISMLNKNSNHGVSFMMVGDVAKMEITSIKSE